jgi:superfamily II DNA/RNA helicase
LWERVQIHLREKLWEEKRFDVGGRGPHGRRKNPKLVDYYHADRSPEDREAVQKSWMSGETLILAATVAFGMGIDKADVRWVFHHSLPKSLEGLHRLAHA